MPRVRQVARAFKECTRSRRTAMFPLQLRPASAVDPRALLPHVQKDFEQIARDGLGAKSTLVVETFSEESFFRPRGAAQDRRREEASRGTRARVGLERGARRRGVQVQAGRARPAVQALHAHDGAHHLVLRVWPGHHAPEPGSALPHLATTYVYWHLVLSDFVHVLREYV